MSKPIEDVIVIGGGIIGLASAHFMQQAGLKVRVIDQGEIGKGCSHGNCGLICPSHVPPLPRPGVLLKSFFAMLNPKGAFSIKPRLDPRLWGWLFSFASHCNSNNMRIAGKGREALLMFSREFYASFIEEESIDCDWEQLGCLFVYGSEKTLDAYDPVDKLLREEYGIPAQKLTGQELEQMEPAFRPGVASGAWYYKQDAHMRADKLITGWKKLLQNRGVEFIEHCEFKQFVATGSSAQGIMVQRNGADQPEQLRADAIVLSTGAWTPLLNRELGCRIPIQPGKGYSITMPRPEICPRYPMILEDEKVAITPMQSGYRLGSTMEFAGYDRSINPDRLNILRTGSEKYLREPYCEPIEETWYGWRPMTPNGLPIISHAPRFSNVVIAAGHNMIGLMTAPATGRHVAELVTGTKTCIDASPYLIR